MIDYSADGMLAQLLRNLWDAANNGNQERWEELVRQGEGALASLLESFDSTMVLGQDIVNRIRPRHRLHMRD